jgi:hypothetical protein
MIRNSTPEQIQQNSSEIYTISMCLKPASSNIISDSYLARIAIDGEMHRMSKIGNLAYSYEYRRPTDKHRTGYYFEVDYRENRNGAVRTKSERSELYNLTIANRYVVGFESNRGVPGSKVALLGRGFEKGDCVEIDDTPCETTFVSQNVLSFAVPVKHPGKYRAKLVSDNGDIGLGEFCLDPVQMCSSLDSIGLSCGEKQLLMISISFSAPKEGIAVEATTNVPDSVIMKDIFIPAGARSASVVVQGGLAGSGMLYLSADGFEDLKIPVEIVSADRDDDEDDGDFSLL